MTTSAVTPIITFQGTSGSGTLGPFSLIKDSVPITFKDNSHIKVYRYDSGTDTSPTLLVENTDYTLTGGPSAGAITLTSPQTGLLDTEFLQARKEQPKTQDASFGTGANFSSATVEEALDKAVRMLQEVDARTKLSHRHENLQGDTVPSFGPLEAAIGKIPYFSGTAVSPTVSYISASGLITLANDLASGSSKIDIVAAGIGNINTVAGIASDVTAVADIDSEVVVVAGIANDVTEVANAIDLVAGSALANRATMTALPSSTLIDGKAYEVLSRSYIWDATSTETANDVTVIAHDTITAGRFLLQDGGVLEFNDGDNFDDVWAAFTSTTSSGTAQLPGTGQRSLFINPGKHQVDLDTYDATGQAQSICGGGLNSILQRAHLRFEGFDAGSVSDIYLLGDGSKTNAGIEFKGTSSSVEADTSIVDRVRVRDHSIGLYLNASDTAEVAQILINQSFFDSNDIGLKGVNCFDTIFVGNKFRANDTNNVLIEGGGQYKFVGCDVSSVTDGTSMILRGTVAQPLVESYFADTNITHGSKTETLTITAIESHNGGAQVKITFSANHYLIPGYDECDITGTTNHNGTDVTVDDVLSATQIVIDEAYVADESAGTLTKRYPGLYFDADVSSAATVYDMFFNGGHANISRMRGLVRNAVFCGVRAWGAKTLGYFETDPDSVMFMGSGMGRPGSTSATSSAGVRTPAGSDMYWGGSAVNHGYLGMFQQLDPHDRNSGFASLDSLHYGIKRPYESAGLAANQWPKAFAFSAGFSDGWRVGVGEQHRRFYLSSTDPATADLVIEDNALRVDAAVTDVNQVRVQGGATGSGVQVSAGGDDTNVAITLKGKGTGAVRLTSGDGTNQVLVNNTGLGVNGTSPIAKPTVTGARDDGTALASLLTALANYGFITDSTTAT